jgi:hypothetical protein
MTRFLEFPPCLRMDAPMVLSTYIHMCKLIMMRYGARKQWVPCTPKRWTRCCPRFWLIKRYIVIHTYFYCRTCCWREVGKWVKPKLLNFKKEEKDDKPFTLSYNVGKVLGTQPPTMELILSLRRLLLQKKISSQKLRKLLRSLPM